jgi:hypothetical protein
MGAAGTGFEPARLIDKRFFDRCIERVYLYSDTDAIRIGTCRSELDWYAKRLQEDGSSVFETGKRRDQQ